MPKKTVQPEPCKHESKFVKTTALSQYFCTGPSYTFMHDSSGKRICGVDMDQGQSCHRIAYGSRVRDTFRECSPPLDDELSGRRSGVCETACWVVSK